MLKVDKVLNIGSFPTTDYLNLSTHRTINRIMYKNASVIVPRANSNTSGTLKVFECFLRLAFTERGGIHEFHKCFSLQDSPSYQSAATEVTLEDPMSGTTNRKVH